MKTSRLFRALTTIGSSLLLALSAHAGPGPQYWQNAKASDKTSTSQSPAATGACPGSELVPIITQRAAQPNGRGPLVTTTRGTERICHVCPVTIAETANAWSNHRGPLQTKEGTKVGVPHVCATGCAMAKS